MEHPVSAQDGLYFRQPRHDVAALIPPDAKRVLDIGCGFGALGRHLAATRGCEMHGIEANPEARAHLEGCYARFAIGDAQGAFKEFIGERYDCIVFADVLEHLVDPWTALADYSKLLAAGGSIVASIPNVRNFALLWNLAVRGRWRYAAHGLLDRTHLRFFTRSELHALFEHAGLRIEEIRTNKDRYTALQWLAAAMPTLIVPDLKVCQFLVRARADSAAA